MRWQPMNGGNKPPVDYEDMFTVIGFMRQLKKQIPGLKLDQSHIYKTVKIIEKILDDPITL